MCHSRIRLPTYNVFYCDWIHNETGPFDHIVRHYSHTTSAHHNPQYPSDGAYAGMVYQQGIPYPSLQGPYFPTVLMLNQPMLDDHHPPGIQHTYQFSFQAIETFRVLEIIEDLTVMVLNQDCLHTIRILISLGDKIHEGNDSKWESR